MVSKVLPPQHRALVQQEYGQPLQVVTRPTPQPTPGSAIIKVTVANVLSYMEGIYNGDRKYAYPTPLVTGFSAIGRVAAVGNDATSLQTEQLVYVDSVIRGRDNASAIILSGIAEGGSEASQKLIRGEWRDSTYAEYVKVPLENCIPLNESLLCGPREDGGLAYRVEKLAYLGVLLVPFGGLRDVRLEAGETVIIAPATGVFGGAAVLVALAMGARVIAMGRNKDRLAELQALSSRRIQTVQITGNSEEELAELQKLGPADVFFDISPPEASTSSHIKSGILALRHGGRASLMAGYLDDVAIPYRTIMRKDIKLRGKWMYSREDILQFVKLIEGGNLRLGEEDGISLEGLYPLENWQEAFAQAKAKTLAGQIVLLHP